MASAASGARTSAAPCWRASWPRRARRRSPPRAAASRSRTPTTWAGGINRIAAESQAYYLLGYKPTNPLRDGSFRKIEVKLERARGERPRPQGVLRGARRPEPPSAGGTKDARLPAPPSIRPTRAMPSRMRMSALRLSTRRGSARRACSSPARSTSRASPSRSARGASDRRPPVPAGGGPPRDRRALPLRPEGGDEAAAPPRASSLARSWLPRRAATFELAPGGYQAKIVVRDTNSRRIGTIVHEFEVPKLDELRTSTPLLTDQVQPGQDRPRPVLRVRRAFTPESTLYCEYEVYGAAIAPDGTVPRVVAGYEIRRADGSVVSRVEPTPDPPQLARQGVPARRRSPLARHARPVPARTARRGPARRARDRGQGAVRGRRGLLAGARAGSKSDASHAKGCSLPAGRSGPPAHRKRSADPNHECRRS